MITIPQQLCVAPNEGFSEEKDIFGYKPYGERMMALVKSLANPSVILLDGAWGSGKTTFIKMWQGLLENNNVHTIYIDAFSEDYQHDVFSVFSGEIYALIKKHSICKAASREFIKAAKNILKGMAFCAAKTGLKAIISNSFDELKLENFKDIKKEIFEYNEKIFDNIIDKNIKQRESIKKSRIYFKIAFERVANSLFKKSGNPLVIIIDDLDRCKPTFAVEFIEMIKHYFTVDNVHFVLVTNSEQLNNAISFVYGVKEPNVYLEKFYNIYISINSFKQSPTVDNEKVFIRKIFSSFKYDRSHSDFVDNCIKTISAIAKANRLSLRKIEKIATYTAICLASGDKLLKLNCVLPTLCAIKVCDYDLYKKTLHSSLTAKDISSFIKESPHISSRDAAVLSSTIEIFTALLGGVPERSSVEYVNKVSYEASLSTDKMISYTCGLIELFAMPSLSSVAEV